MAKVKTAVLISGKGSNLAALIAAARQADFPAEITLVISNKAEAGGLGHARAAHIPNQVISHQGLTREAYDAQLDAALRAAGIELVCLAGFMRILSDGFVQQWAGRLLNIHPSLLPKYKGLDTHARALAAGDKEHGATVHWVTAELDAGEIIAQQSLPILPGDTAESLAQRVHTLEHWIYPQALRQVALSLQ